MLISIIIPVYNAEEFIEKCLDSIKNQTYKNIEVIIINDGSTDNSENICREYCKNNENFRLISKKNGGVSSARNIGLSEAKGDYIGFVDPDDWIEKDMFENLYKLIKDYNADISICGYIKESKNGILNKQNKKQIIELTEIEALNEIIREDGFKGFLWNKLFSRELIKSYKDIFFYENIHFSEDLLFCCEYILKSKKVIYDTTPYYHYIIHDNNICNSNYNSKKVTSLDAFEKIIDILSNKKGIDINKYKNLYMNISISLLMNYIKENKKEIENYKKLRKSLYKYNLSDITSNYIKISCILCRINPKFCYLIWKVIK